MALKVLLLDVGNTLLTERPSRFELYARAAVRAASKSTSVRWPR